MRDGVNYLDGYKPVNVMRNNTKIAGWSPQTKTGELVEFDGTYDTNSDTDDTTNVVLTGKTEQTVTVQGKNLFDKTKIITNKKVTSISDGTIIYSSVFSVSPFVSVLANTNYYLSGVVNYSSCAVGYYDASKTYISGNTANSGLKTTPADTKYIVITLNTDSVNSLQLELGSTSTAYTPFVPNSPSPDYPSPISSAGDCNLTISDQSGVRQAIPIPTLDKLGDIADTYNPITGERIERNIVEQLNGLGWLVATVTRDPNCISFYKGNTKTGLSNDGINAYSNMFRGIDRTTAGLSTTLGENCGLSVSGTLWITIFKSRLATPDVAGFNTFLANLYNAGTPVILVHPRSAPITTMLTSQTIPTYPLYTQITTDGAVKAQITATVKVQD